MTGEEVVQLSSSDFKIVFVTLFSTFFLNLLDIVST